MSFESWGRFPKVSQAGQFPSWRGGINFNDIAQSYLPYGFGRSYGDSCLNDGGVHISGKNFDHFSFFDEETGILTLRGWG